MKLMAIFSQGRRSKTRGLLEEVLARILGVLERCRRQGSGFWGSRMTDEGVPEKEVFIGQNEQGQI